MNDKEFIKIRNQIANKLYALVANEYNECLSFSNKAKTNKSLTSIAKMKNENYSLMTNYYNQIRQCKSRTELNTIRAKIVAKVAEIRQAYKELATKKATSQNKDLITEQMEALRLANLFMYNFVNEMDAPFKQQTEEKRETVTHINTPIPTVKKQERTVTPTERKPEIKQQTPKTYQTDPNLYRDNDIKNIEIINRTICQLKEKYYSLNQYSEEAKELRKKIYAYSVRREEGIRRICGNEGIKLLLNVESIEDSIYSKPVLVTRKPYRISSSSYMARLNGLISAISDLKCKGYDSKYYKGPKGDYKVFNKLLDASIAEYHNMIMAVADVSQKPGIIKTSNDILSLLNIYNIDGDYTKFKDINNGGMVGGERISIEAYREGVNRINGMIDTIRQQSSLAIKSNGGAITVNDRSNARSEDEKHLQIAKEELYRKYLASKKEMLSQGTIRK